MNMNSKKPVTGILILTIGTLHTALGVVTWVSGPPMPSVDQTAYSFWFTVFGVLAMVLGVAVIEASRAIGHVPPTVLVGVAVTFVFGVLVLPASGFWSLLVPLATGTIGWLSSRRSSQVRREMSPEGHLG